MARCFRSHARGCLAPGSCQLCSLPCRRIPLEEVPEDEDECAAWLHRLYQEKVSAAWRFCGLHAPISGGRVGARWGLRELVAAAFPHQGEVSYPR